MINRMNLFMGKGFKKNEDLETYYTERSSNIRNFRPGFNWFVDKVNSNGSMLSKRSILELAETLDLFRTRINKAQSKLDEKTLDKIRTSEKEYMVLISNSKILLKEDVQNKEEVRASELRDIVLKIQDALDNLEKIKI